MVAIIDYGVGNLFSLGSSFAAIGEEAVVTEDPSIIAQADRIILPGVGAFADAMHKLHTTGLDDVLKAEVQKGKPVMGICLGMQMLFEKSYEYGVHKGLALIKGNIKPIRDVIAPGLKIPHIGWNALHFTGNDCPLFRYIGEGEYVYFVHSFANESIASNDSSPNLLLTSSLYLFLSGSLRLIETVSIIPSISGTISLLLIRFPTPFVLILIGLLYVFLTYEATSFNTSNASVGSPNPQKTTSS